MPVIADTSYPRLPTEPGPTELEAFTPEPVELAFARQKTRHGGPRLALLVLLKTFQHLGRVVRLADVPTGIIDHIASVAGLAGHTGELAGYGDSTYRIRLASLVRGFVGVAGYDREARGIAARACIEAARTRDDLADIVNAGIEELLRQRRELPAFGALLKLARTARALVNRSYHRRIATALPPGTRERLATLLVVPAGATRSGWDQAKADPPRPSPQRMREHLAHLAWLRGQAVAEAAFAGVPDRKLRQFAAEARSLGAADLGRVVESKRLALMAALLRGQVAQALDDAAEMFVRLTMRMHNRAREALDEYRVRHAAETDALVALLRETVLVCQDREAERDARLAAVENLLLPDGDAILARCEAHAAFAGNNYLPLLARFYGGQRAAFLRFLEHAALVSTSQDRSMEEAIAFLLAHRVHRRAKLRTVADVVQHDGTTVLRPLDLSWVGEKWWPLLTGGRTAREPASVEVDRRHFEICVFTQVVNELKSGDLCIPGSEEYGDYRDQLVSWDEYRSDVAGYAEQAGVPADAAAFVATLKARLTATASTTDRGFPDNEHVEIVDGEPVVKRLRAREVADGAAFLERLLKARLAPAGVLEALADTEHWLNWTRHFGPVSGFEAKLERPRERYVATAFCYGCGLGPSQAARSLKGLDRRHVAHVNQRHMTEVSLDEAITGVIDAYARVGLHRFWGTGESASADGMKWEVHPESLKSSYHLRYGGYGGIGYYLVSDTYIALFSRFLACGAYEGHAILDFVAENRSLLQPSMVHSDTHGQSAAIFGLAHLLGIELMPRIRSWQDLHLFRPDAGARYEHIDGLFTANIDWPLIEAHLPDMLRVVLSIRAGRLLPSAILRRLATYSRKNRLYFAFREIGRAIRTNFLLRYLSSVELRRTIQAATNKSELFNKYAQWVSFGSAGLATAAERDEQRKMIKYNHLVANLLIFHTAVGMTRALDEIAAGGHAAAITPEALAGTSPYLNEHLNRFGSYELDLGRPPPPLPFELPPRLRPSRQSTAAVPV
ncbi:MAG TPA: Tn3 family transposase [Steroidobacteraceae bacterium]|nr:Tn3 family transposase [Steroidobacteraceae bacterium]